MKKTVLFTLSVICVMLLLCGCGGSPSGSNTLEGVWAEVDGEGILYFAEDGTGLSANVTYTSQSFEYEEKDAKLTFIGEKEVVTDYTVDKDILTITVDGADYQYEKVKLAEDEIEGYLQKGGIDINVLPEAEVSKKETETETEPETTPAPEPETAAPDAPGAMTDEEIAESIVGAWKGSDGSISLVYIFNGDGTGYAAVFPMTYTVKNGIITVTVEGFGETETGSARYEIDGDCMHIETSDGSYVMYRTEIPDELKQLIDK